MEMDSEIDERSKIRRITEATIAGPGHVNIYFSFLSVDFSFAIVFPHTF